MDANLSIGAAIDHDLANQSGKKLDLHFALDDSHAKRLINASVVDHPPIISK